MKSLISTTAALAVLAMSGAAMAQESVEVGGDAPKLCTLPSDFAYSTGTGGAQGGQLNGTTWNIPTTQFSSNTGQAVVGGEIAIRLRGHGFCNTSHTIEVSSDNGGLTHMTGNAPTTVAPAGFAVRRNVQYQALWVGSGTGGGTVAYGGIATLNATGPGVAPAVRPFTVSPTLAPPGSRDFDIRIGVPRNVTTPLVAGAYKDVVRVTLRVS